MQAHAFQGDPAALLRARGTKYIQRVDPTGWLAPAGGCDGAQVGPSAPVPNVDHYLYRAG